MSRVLAVAVILGFVFSRFATAQDALPDPPPPTAEPAPSAEAPSAEAPSAEAPSAEPAAQAEGAVGRPSEQPIGQEHVIYLPFEKLREALKDEESSIVLPYAQFLKMWDRPAESDPPPPGPPVEGVITRADYVASVRGDQVHLEAALAVEVLGDAWARLPVRFGDAAIGAATAKDDAVLLRGVGEGHYELLVRGKGTHEVKLNMVVGVTTTPEGRSFTVECPAVGVSNLELEIPEPELSVQVVPRRTSQRLPGPEDATRLRVVLGATERFTVSWQPEAGVAHQVAGLANVQNTLTVDIGDGVVHTHAVFDYQILRGALDELVVEAPADHRLLDVRAPGLRDWQAETADNRQHITVRLHAPATGAVRLELHTETPLAEEAFTVGGVHAVGVARESGILAVRGGEDVGLEYVAREALTRVDAADVPEPLRRPRSTFYKFFTPEYRLSVAAAPLEPRVVVDSRLAVLLDKTRVATRGEFHCQVTRSGIFSLAFRVPPGFQVDEVRSEAMERFEIDADTDGDAQRLTVYFTGRLLGELAVSVTASSTRDRAAGELTLPLLEPLYVTREEGLVAVIAPESLEVKTNTAQLQGAWAATPAELAARGFEPQVPDGSSLAATFAFGARPLGIAQTITERPRRILAKVGTLANIREDVVHVATTLRCDVQFAGVNTFRLAVPAAVSDRLQIEGEGIKERRRADEAAADGMVEWTIVLHSEALGEVVYTATYDWPMPAADLGAPFELEPIRALDADRETGEIAVLKDRALSIEAAPVGLEEIDPRELSQPLGGVQPHLAYRYYRHPARLSLHVTKHELQEVVRTVVDRAYIEAVVTKDGPVTMRARYELKSSERQRLAVTLPNPRILGITVAGQTVPPEIAPAAPGAGPDDKTYFLNVARTGDADESFHVSIVFETSRPKEDLGVTNLLRLPLPRFDEGVKFQRTYVRAWVPREYRLIGNPEGFGSHIEVGLWDSRAINPAADNPDTWFPPDPSSFDFQVDGTAYLFSSLAAPPELEIGYWHIPTMTLIAGAAALALGLVLLPFSLETRVFTILALVLLVLFVGLFQPSLVNSWLLAARLGIAAVVALWTVAWLLRARRAGVFQRMLAGEGLAVPAATGAGVPGTVPVGPPAQEQGGGSDES